MLALLLLACTSLGSVDPDALAGPPPGERPPMTKAARSYVTNPTSQASLAVYLDTPPGAGPWPALVVSPGALHGGREGLPGRDRIHYLAAGFALVTFDPDGRGDSGGAEDYGGPTQQDGLAAVISAARAMPQIDPDRVGVLSLSFGITMATGALTRHQTGARFLLDWEGPANRSFTAFCGREARSPRADAIAFAPCEDDAFWSTREADRGIGSLRVPYERIQFAQDHVQPDASASVAMLQAARAGGVPTILLNGTVAPEVRLLADLGSLPDGRERAKVLAERAAALMTEVSGQAMTPVDMPLPPARPPKPPR